MSILSNDIQTLTMDCFYERGSIAWGAPRGHCHPELENKLIDGFYSCDPNNWLTEYEGRVKSLLNAENCKVTMTDHPFADEIKQIWVDYVLLVNGQTVQGNYTLYVSKKNQSGDTELVAYGANDVAFTADLTLLQVKQNQPPMKRVLPTSPARF